MKLETELKPGDIVLLKVLACILILFFTLRSYYKVVVFIDALQGLNTIFIIAILYLFYRYGYDI